jgi:hypothetical protein
MKLTRRQLVPYSKIKENVQNVRRIQRKIIRFPTNIIRQKTKSNSDNFAIVKHSGEKKPPGWGGWRGA